MKYVCFILLVIGFFCYSSSVAQDDDFTFGYTDDVNPKWEIGVDFGVSTFVGTMNLYSQDLFKLYRTDGNSTGYSFQGFIAHKINHCFYISIEGATTTLTGTVTYKGVPPSTSPIVPNTQRVYNTNNTFGGLLLGIDIFNLSDKNDYIYGKWRCILKCGIGFNKTEVITLPFIPEEQLYDFADSKATELAIPFGAKLLIPIAFNASLYANLSFIAVGGSKLDGYYLSDDPINESFPTNPSKSMSQAVDLYSTLTFGISFNW